jgi:hypothetical protein
VSDDHGHPHEEPVNHVAAAFLVVLHHDGQVTATSDLTQVQGMVTARSATLTDMYSAAAHVQKNVQVQETVDTVLTTARKLIGVTS